MSAQYKNYEFIRLTLQDPLLEGYKSSVYQIKGCYRNGNNNSSNRITLPEMRTLVNGRMSDFQTSCVATGNNWLPVGNSGYTVATGFDITQHDTNYLIKKFTSVSSIFIKLAPYTRDARTTPPENPGNTRITIPEGNIIDKAVISDSIDTAVRAYERSFAASKKFEEINMYFQAVLVSHMHQYGSAHNLSAPLRTVWQYAARQEWETARQILAGISDQYSARRRKEAGIIATGIESGNNRMDETNASQTFMFA